MAGDRGAAGAGPIAGTSGVRRGAGEFNQRAVLNGRLDLTRAEAISQLVAARSRRAADLAIAGRWRHSGSDHNVARALLDRSPAGRGWISRTCAVDGDALLHDLQQVRQALLNLVAMASGRCPA